MTAMKMNLARWVKKVDGEDLVSFESQISFTSDENNGFSCKINNSTGSFDFEVDCTCLSRMLGEGGFTCAFSSFQGLGR